MRRPVLASFCLVAFAAVASAQQMTLLEPPVRPEHPTAGQEVFARVRIDACNEVPVAVERVGSAITLRYQVENCPILPPVFESDVSLGVLPEGTYDLRLFEVSDPAHPRLDDEAIFAVGPAPCGERALCLLAGRYSVTAEWTTGTRQSGFGHPVRMTDESGAFWFFGSDNVELMVKVLDACTLYSRHWFFAAGLTDVRVVVRVHDSLTGAERTYEGPLGRPFQPITDTNAFGCP